MDRYAVGDVIAHRLIPTFEMSVLAVQDCETDFAGPRSEPHAAYTVRDPEGQEDTVCGHDVRLVRAAVGDS